MDFGEFTVTLQNKGFMSIATSIEQSKKLLELGIKPETADMYLHQNGELSCNYKAHTELDKEINESRKRDGYPYEVVGYPAWSLTALLDLMPVHIITDKLHLRLRMDKGENDFGIWYVNLNDGFVYREADFTCTNPFGAAVEMIEWLVENNYITELK